MVCKDGGDDDGRYYNRRRKTREETPLISLNINCVTVFNLLSYMFNWAFKDLIADRVLKLTAFKFWWWSA